MRQLWAAARGRIDMEMMLPLTVLSMFGRELSQAQYDMLHPLRRAERRDVEQPDGGEAGWAVLGAALKSLNQDRGK